MHRFHKTFVVGLLLLALGAFGIWRFIQRSTPPPTPKAHVTIPEGWTVAQINQRLSDEGVLVRGELSVELEGKLFPDTYEFFLDSTPEVVEEKFLVHLEEQLQAIGASLADDDIEETLTVASLIEREVHDPSEKRIVSGILWKRLNAGIPLQVDATLCYIKEGMGRPCLPILTTDKALQSPYNTYENAGLPPGPIGNPGIDSIKAALNPASSPYLYYISDPDTGKAIFAETLDEHNSNIVKYLSE